MVERRSHSSDPTNIENLHALLRAGRETNWKKEVEARIGVLETQHFEDAQQFERKKNLKQLMDEREKKAVQAVGLQDEPSYSLLATPLEVTEIRSILRSTPESISQLMEHPPSLRYGGWGMETGDQARLIGGEFRRVKSDKYKLIDLYRDGTCIFVCTAGHSLLGWGNTFANGKINPIALIETTYMFFHFYFEVSKQFSSSVKILRAELRLHNFQSGGSAYSLEPYGVESMSHRSTFNTHPAPESEFSFSFEVDLNSFDPAKTAFDSLREIYGWFGIEEDKIPYLTAQRDSVSVEKLKNPKLEYE